MSLIKYVLRRVALILPILLGVTIVMFTLTYLLPGDPALVRLGGSPAFSQIEKMREKMGLDKPVYIQYLIYMRDLLSGDLGICWVTDRPVLEDLKVRFPATLELALCGFMIAVITGIPMGVVSAIRRNRLIDHFSRVISISGLSIPLFWLGLIFIYVFYFSLNWSPAPIGRLDPGLGPPKTITGMYIIDSVLTGNWVTLRSSFMHLILPAATLALINLAPIARMVRSTMLDTLGSEYIRMERAAGIPNREVYKDALRNSMIPILTITGLVFGYMMAGIIVLEQIFSWPGMGLYALQAMEASDNDPMQAYILIMALTFISINLVVDILYAAIDPRIRYK